MPDLTPLGCSSTTQGVGHAVQVIGNTFSFSSEKAVLYRRFEQVNQEQGSSGLLKDRGHIGDTIRCFLLLQERQSCASVFLWFLRVTFSHRAFTAVTRVQIPSGTPNLINELQRRR
jgi:hypothetical protein